MGLILTKIQFTRSSATDEDLTSGEIPYYEVDGKLYLKETGEEVEIVQEDEIEF